MMKRFRFLWAVGLFAILIISACAGTKKSPTPSSTKPQEIKTIQPILTEEKKLPGTPEILETNYPAQGTAYPQYTSIAVSTQVPVTMEPVATGAYPQPIEVLPTPTEVFTQAITEEPAPTQNPTEITPEPSKILPTIDPRYYASDPSSVRLDSGKIQFIEFFAYWDGTSQAMSPIVHGLEAKYKDQMNFVYLDIDDPKTDPFKQELNYKMQPHYVLLDANGKKLKQWSGYVQKGEFESAFQTALEP